MIYGNVQSQLHPTEGPVEKNEKYKECIFKNQFNSTRGYEQYNAV